MELLQKSFKLYFQIVVASFLCFVLIMSFKMMGTAFLTKEVGYTVHGTLSQDEESIELYTHYYENGEDKKYQEYEEEGYTLFKNAIRSQTSKRDALIWSIITQAFLIMLVGVFIYNNLWNLGHKDKNAVNHGQQDEDKLRGLKIGSIAIIPSVVLLTILTIGKETFAKNISIASYGFLNTYLYEAILFVSNGGGYFSKLDIWQIVAFYAMFIIIPIIAQVSYILGYKDIVISERLTYKKK